MKKIFQLLLPYMFLYTINTISSENRQSTTHETIKNIVNAKNIEQCSSIIQKWRKDNRIEKFFKGKWIKKHELKTESEIVFDGLTESLIYFLPENHRLIDKDNKSIESVTTKLLKAYFLILRGNKLLEDKELEYYKWLYLTEIGSQMIANLPDHQNSVLVQYVFNNHIFSINLRKFLGIGSSTEDFSNTITFKEKDEFN